MKTITTPVRAFGLCIAILVLLTHGTLAEATQSENPVLGHVRIAGVSVSGLSPQQARQRLAGKLQPKLDGRLVITDGLKRMQRKRREMGIGLDLEGMVGQAKAGVRSVSLHFRVNHKDLQIALRHVAPYFDFPGRNVRVIEQQGRLKIIPSVDVRKVDVGASAQRLAVLLEKNVTTHVLLLTIKKARPKRRPPSSRASVDG